MTWQGVSVSTPDKHGIFPMSSYLYVFLDEGGNFDYSHRGN